MASRAGVIGNLPWQRGTSQPGVKMAPRGPQHKEAITAELKIQIQKLGINKFIDTYGSSVATSILGYEASKFIPTIHGGEELPPIKAEPFPAETKVKSWDESFKAPEPIETTEGLEAPPQEKIVPPGFQKPEPLGTDIVTKDIVKQTKDLVTKEPEFGALTEVEKQTALLEKGDKPDPSFSRRIPNS
jgi:hypothetical protein